MDMMTNFPNLNASQWPAPKLSENLPSDAAWCKLFKKDRVSKNLWLQISFDMNILNIAIFVTSLHPGAKICKIYVPLA